MDQLEGGTISFPHSYDITRARGRVGYATIYEGTRDPFDKPVWIHVFDLTELDLDEADLELRLENSALRTSQIAVTGALRAVDFGEVDEAVPFIITERLDAPTLAAILGTEGTLSPEEVTTLIERLAGILGPCHESGFAHGALHPEFIYVPDGDFSRAHLGHFEIGWTLQEMRQLPQGLTRADALSVLAPERFGASSAAYDPNLVPFGPEDDLWSLGALAYRCLVGQAPYFTQDGDVDDALVRVTQEEARGLEELGIREDISKILSRALSRTPGARQASVEALAGELRDALSPPPPEAQEPAPRRPEPRVEVDDDDDLLEETWETSNTGTVAGVAVLLLITTNLFWVIQLVSQEPWLPQLKPTATPLPLEVKSQPPGAKVLVTPKGSAPIPATTPHRFVPTPGQEYELRFQMAGYKETLMTLQPRDDVQDVTIVLEATP